MAKINKVFCDKCNKELTVDYIKLNVVKPTKNHNGYMIYPTEGRIDLCPECFAKFKEFLKQ